MSKWWLLVVVFLAVGCSGIRHQIKVENQVELDKEFIRRVVSYWQNRYNLEVKSAFSQEAPYVQEMVSLEKYANYLKLYVKQTPILTKVSLKKVTKQNKSDVCLDVELFLRYKDKTVKRELEDCWLKLRKTWYHVLRNPLIFPELN